MKLNKIIAKKLDKHLDVSEYCQAFALVYTSGNVDVYTIDDYEEESIKFCRSFKSLDEFNNAFGDEPSTKVNIQLNLIDDNLIEIIQVVY